MIWSKFHNLGIYGFFGSFAQSNCCIWLLDSEEYITRISGTKATWAHGDFVTRSVFSSEICKHFPYQKIFSVFAIMQRFIDDPVLKTAVAYVLQHLVKRSCLARIGTCLCQWTRAKNSTYVLQGQRSLNNMTYVMLRSLSQIELSSRQ